MEDERHYILGQKGIRTGTAANQLGLAEYEARQRRAAEARALGQRRGNRQPRKLSLDGWIFRALFIIMMAAMIKPLLPHATHARGSLASQIPPAFIVRH